MGFLVLFWDCFLILFLFENVESSKYLKHFSGSLTDTLLPNCLLFHFFFVRMTQGFCFVASKKQMVLLHYPSICASATMTVQSGLVLLGHPLFPWAWAGGTGQELGRIEGWGCPVAYQEISLHSQSSFPTPLPDVI